MSLQAFTLTVDARGVCTSADLAPPPGGIFTTPELVGESLLDALAPPLDTLFGDALATLRRTHKQQLITAHLDAPPRAFVGTLCCLHESAGALFRIVIEPAPDPLRDPSSALASVLNKLDQGVLIQGPGSEILHSNDAALRMLGLTEAQLLGSDSFDPRWRVIHEDGSPFPGDTHPTPTAIATRAPVHDVIMGVYRPVTGDQVWLKVNAVPELDADGEVVQVVCSFTDVTAEREATAALRREHELLRQIMHASVAGITVLDPTGRITWANRAAEQILGLSRDAIESRSYNAPEWRSTDVDGGPWPDEKNPFVRVMTTRAPVLDIRHAIEWPNGARKILSINGAPILDERGEVVQLVFAVVDVTREHQESVQHSLLQDRFDRVARLESLATLAGGVAHDFNNLLMGSVGALDALRLELADTPLPQQIDDLLDLIEQSNTRATNLVNDLLAFARQPQRDPSPLDLNAVVEQLRPLAQDTLPERATFSVELAASLPPISVDRDQLDQLILQLTSNASQALTAEPGRVTLRTRTLTVTASDVTGIDVGDRPPGSYVLLEVEDSGVGIDAETRPRIFDPFFSTRSSGHGLGLAAVSGIVTLHKGFIQVISSPGRGSCFRVGFPCSADALTPTHSEPSPVETPEHPGVLVVDDEPLIRKLLLRLLTTTGCEPIVAEDGESGLALFREDPSRVQVALVDMTMPGISGLEVAAQLQSERPDLPVILMSGYSELEITDLKQPVHFLKKPFRSKNLFELLKQLLPGFTGERKKPRG